ncbi:hypothetical protein BB559_006979 [Furculomyces boomerangus]|uniref:Myosin motor domain-containing protein n=1 Tax=Furculomyces boomerangus TaxID=61424 RepID=A0A2T9XZI1_9FUNG|nr:hypothetical protein BB559_006979 [Furculomyces boomerangus]
MLKNISSKNSKLFEKIIASQYVINCFTNANLDENNMNSSRANSLLEIQYNDTGKPVCAKSYIYYIESNIFLSNPSQKQNKNIFLPQIVNQSSESMSNESDMEYDLTCFQVVEMLKKLILTEQKTDPKPKQRLWTKIKTIFKSKSKTEFENITENSSNEMDKLKLSMELAGINSKLFLKVIQFIYGIVKLSFLKVTENKKTKKLEITGITECLTESLGFVNNESELVDLITTTKSAVNNNQIIKTLTLEAANTKKRELCWILYRQTVYWVLEKINFNLGNEKFKNTTSILDTMDTNNDTGDFDLMCINYFNERLFRFVNYEMFESQNAYYSNKGLVDIPNIELGINNKRCIDFFSSSNFGIFSLIDEQTKNIIKDVYSKTHLLNSLKKFFLMNDDSQSIYFKVFDSKIVEQLKSNIHLESINIFTQTQTKARSR